MKDTTPPILRRRNIKYNRLIKSAILLMCSIILGISAMQMQVTENEGETKKIVEKTAKKEVKKENVSYETAELSAGVSKNMLQMLKEPLPEPQVEKLDVDTVTSAVDAEPEIVYKSLEEVKISRDMDITETTGLSREDFCELLSNFKYDYAGFYERYAGFIWDLSQKYRVNEIFMCGVYGIESLYGSNASHVKAHNYGSIMTSKVVIVTDEKGEEKKITRLELKTYLTDEEGIEANFKLFADCYLNPDGKYYKGVTLDSIGDTYCPPTEECPSWADKVYECMKVFLEEE